MSVKEIIQKWYDHTQWFRELIWNVGSKGFQIANMPMFATFYFLNYLLVIIVCILVLHLSWKVVKKSNLGELLYRIRDWLQTNVVVADSAFNQPVKYLLKKVATAAQVMSAWLARGRVYTAAENMQQENLHWNAGGWIEKAMLGTFNLLYRVGGLGAADAAYREWWLVRVPRRILTEFFEFLSQLDRETYSKHLADVEDMQKTVTDLVAIYRKRYNKEIATVPSSKVWELLTMPHQQRRFTKFLLAELADDNKFERLIGYKPENDDQWVKKAFELARLTQLNDETKTPALSTEQIDVIETLIRKKAMNVNKAIDMARSELSGAQQALAFALMDARDLTATEVDEAVEVAKTFSGNDAEKDMLKSLVRVNVSPLKAKNVIDNWKVDKTAVFVRLVESGLSFKQAQNEVKSHLATWSNPKYIQALKNIQHAKYDLEQTISWIRQLDPSQVSLLSDLSAEKLHCTTLPTLKLVFKIQSSRSIPDILIGLCNVRVEKESDMQTIANFENEQWELFTFLIQHGISLDNALTVSKAQSNANASKLMSSLQKNSESKRRLLGSLVRSISATQSLDSSFLNKIMQRIKIVADQLPVQRPLNEIQLYTLFQKEEFKKNYDHLKSELKMVKNELPKQCEIVQSTPLDEFKSVLNSLTLSQSVNLLQKIVANLLSQCNVLQNLATLSSEKKESVDSKLNEYSSYLSEYKKLIGSFNTCAKDPATCLAEFEPCHSNVVTDVEPTTSVNVLTETIKETSEFDMNDAIRSFVAMHSLVYTESALRGIFSRVPKKVDKQWSEVIQNVLATLQKKQKPGSTGGTYSYYVGWSNVDEQHVPGTNWTLDDEKDVYDIDKKYSMKQRMIQFITDEISGSKSDTYQYEYVGLFGARLITVNKSAYANEFIDWLDTRKRQLEKTFASICSLGWSSFSGETESDKGLSFLYAYRRYELVLKLYDTLISLLNHIRDRKTSNKQYIKTLKQKWRLVQFYLEQIKACINRDMLRAFANEPTEVDSLSKKFQKEDFEFMTMV